MPAQDLVQVLSTLPPQTDPRLLVGREHFDDAGVVQVRDDLALVQTVDFFPPVVDDPWWFGRIAAANALSDLYAMGATPLSAVAIVVFNTKELPLEMLGQILQGGEDAVREAGAMTLGGHSVADEGVKYGLAVTGVVTPGEQITNAGARPGDVLYLTKALGTGALTTAAKAGKLEASLLEGAMHQMGQLNRQAAEAMAAAGAGGATDVTGYGLAGHAFELAEASGVSVHLSAADLPALPGAEEALARGRASGGAARTLEHLGARLVVADGVSAVRRLLATDSETSGGLLVAVDPGAAQAFEADLARRDVLVARVGEVREGPAAVHLRA